MPTRLTTALLWASWTMALADAALVAYISAGIAVAWQLSVMYAEAEAPIAAAPRTPDDL